MGINLTLVLKTRKEHKCVCCGKPILSGTKALRANGFDYDNLPVNEYTHPDTNCGNYFATTIDLIDDSDIEELLVS